MRASHRLSVGVVAAAVLACAGVSSSMGIATNGLTAAQREEILRAHNAARGRVEVPPLRWSAELAREAQARAEALAGEGCRLGHRPLPEGVGENLLAAVGEGPGASGEETRLVSPAKVVETWAAEAASYDERRGRCKTPRGCAHYTQLVWRDTQEVGCGVAACARPGEVWVCDYRPAGNIEGRKPY